MAMCEKCNNGGYRPQDMVIDGEKFIGPCCASRKALPSVELTPSDLDAGIAITTRYGIQAYAKYEGVEVKFNRSIEEINKWLGQ